MSPQHRDDPEEEETFGIPGKQVRTNLTIKEADYARLCDVAARADMTHASVISTALSIGLGVLEGAAGREVLEGLSMIRFLRGR